MAKFIISAFADEAGDSLSEQIAALWRNGICYIEPRTVNKRSIIFQGDEELGLIRRELDAADIRVSSLGSPIGKYPIEGPFEEQLEDFRRALYAAKLLGTNYVRIFSFLVPKERSHEYRREVLSRLSVMLDMAEREGVTLCHENEAKTYGEQPENVRDLLTSLPRLGGILDPANYVTCNADPLLGLEVTLPSLAYMHVKDATRDRHVTVPPGKGDGYIAEVLTRIGERTDGTVFLTVEPHLKDYRPCVGAPAAFDSAVNSLKDVLRAIGYRESGQHWIR